MKTIILWVLIMPGPRPYPIDTFPTHGACVQAKYDYGSAYSPRDKMNQTNKLICRQQTKIIR